MIHPSLCRGENGNPHGPSGGGSGRKEVHPMEGQIQHSGRIQQG